MRKGLGIFLENCEKPAATRDTCIISYRDKANASNDTRRQLFFSREKEELPRAVLEPAIFCILGRCTCSCTCTCMQLNYQSPYICTCTCTRTCVHDSSFLTQFCRCMHRHSGFATQNVHMHMQGVHHCL